MGLKYWLIQALLLLVNAALIYLIAWALGVDILNFNSKSEFTVFIGIGFGLLLIENVIWDKIHGNA